MFPSHDQRGELTATNNYAPIINANIYAHARIKLIKDMMEIPKEELIYCNTDSIHFINSDNMKRFKISNEVGDYSIYKYQKTGHVFGKNNYKVENEIKSSGVKKGYKIKDNVIEYKRRIDITKAKKEKNINKEKTLKLDLNKLEDVANMKKEYYSNVKLFYDKDEDIKYFINKGVI